MILFSEPDAPWFWAPRTFIIVITSAADDSGAIFLNGVYLGNTGPYPGHTSQTFVVGLQAGCNCLDFQVFDI
jgi:hypothetical protein